MQPPNVPTCWIIAGPNGAGKTTFALEFLPKMADCSYFVNADLIAAGLSPIMPDRVIVSAGRLFLTEIEHRVLSHENFAFETTLSGRSNLQLVDRLLKIGWNVELIYLALPDVIVSKQRVAERVAHGGHDIPLADIERRFLRSLRHLFQDYAHRVSRTSCFMNDTAYPVLIFEQLGSHRTIVHHEYYQLLLGKVSK